MMRIVILTSSELRHTFFRKYVALQDGISVVGSFCESSEKNLVNQISKREENDLRYLHLQHRIQTERDFFQLFCDYSEDRSNPNTIEKGKVNDPEVVQQIINLKPDLLFSFGSSIIKSPLIDAFPNRFINIHLGLSPYYRGSGTNFWPFVNNEPEYCGVTFMKIDAGIDTGEVIHQIRPTMYPSDGFHVICNRLLKQMAAVAALLAQNFDSLVSMDPVTADPSHRYYKNSDFSEAAVQQLHQNFNTARIGKYLDEKTSRDLNVPILKNPALAHE